MNRSILILSVFILCSSNSDSCRNNAIVARTTYEQLIATHKAKFKIPALKNKRAKELQALASMIINRALDRITDIIGPEFTTHSQKIRSYTNQPETKGHANDYVRTSYTWAIADFEDQIKRDDQRLGGIGAITQSSPATKTDLITLELEELNERYEPIIQALITLQHNTRLPKSLTLDALKKFDVVQ
jgi:hypothetical protein